MADLHQESPWCRCGHRPVLGPPLGLLLVFFVLGLSAGDHAYAASAESICGTPAVIFCDDFENEVLPGIWQDGYNSVLHSITSTPINVYRGQKALQATY